MRDLTLICRLKGACRHPGRGDEPSQKELTAFLPKWGGSYAIQKLFSPTMFCSSIT